MVSSAYELALMRPLFDVAIEQERRCTILLYQFDGVTVRFREASRAGGILRRMREAFDARARELGVATQLSVEEWADCESGASGTTREGGGG